MCVAVPAKVISVNGNTAKVEVSNNICEVNCTLVPVKVGDSVLLHAGCVLEVLSKEMADELAEIFGELEGMFER